MAYFFDLPAVQALIRTLLLIAALMLLWTLVKAARHWFAQHNERIADVPPTYDSTPEYWWHLIKVFCADLGARVLTVLAWMATGAICFLWLISILVLFPKTQPVGEKLETGVSVELGKLGSESVDSLSNWLMMGLIFIGAKMLVNANTALWRVIKDKAREEAKSEPEFWQAIYHLISLAIWAMAFVIAYPYLPGANSEALKGLLVMLGTVLTLGSTGIANQIMSGLVLIFSRALKVGDRVIIGSGQDALEGVVVQISTLNIKISNCHDQLITVPNQIVITKPIKNYSLMGKQPGNQISLRLSIGYDAPWRQVQALLYEAARRTTGVLQDPAPYVLQNDLGDFYVSYEMYCHIARESEPAGVSSELKSHVQDCFNQAQVPIVSPHFSKPMPSPTLAKVPDDLPPLPAEALG